MPRFDLEPGHEPFSGYRLERLLGRGGYSEVWRCSSPQGHVALKFMRVDDSSAASHEIRAIQSLKDIRHPHLLEMHQVWLLPGYIVFSMDQAQGTLQDLLQAGYLEFRTALTPKLVCRLLLQVAQAIDFLNDRRHLSQGHTVGFVHGDVKPTNMLLFHDQVRLADFGMAKPMSQRRINCPPRGTPEYAAPEVYQGWLSDQSDQYSLAVSYCQLRCGKLPFAEVPRSFHDGTTRSPPNLSQLSAAEQPIVARALSPIPQERWPNCQEMMQSLIRLFGMSHNGLTKMRAG